MLARLAALHPAPLLPLLRPSMVQALYGVPASGDLGVLLTHRAALFLTVRVACVFSAADAVGLLPLIFVAWQAWR